MKLKAVDHPIAGRLVPDQWGSSLMTFCEIPGLKMFAPKDSQGALQRLEPADRKLVESWRDVPEALVEKCRQFDIFDSLRGLGVFEALFSRTADGMPSDEQLAACQFFQANELRITANIANALLRYYPVARAVDEHWFDQSDCPSVETLAELSPLVTLDGLTYSSQKCEGLVVIALSWKPDWDEEHGLPMFVWKDQVIAIGVEDLFEIFDPVGGEYTIWKRSLMTETEWEYLTRVCEGLGEREEEDFDGEYEDDEDFDE